MKSINILSLIGFLFLNFSCSPHLIEIENNFAIQALPAENITSDSFKAQWELAKDVESYFLFISTQEDMQTLIETPIQVKNNELIVKNLHSNTTYYYQIGVAKRYGKEAEYQTNNDSEVIAVTTKEITKNTFSHINSFKVNGFSGKIKIPRFDIMSTTIEVSQNKKFEKITTSVELKETDKGEFHITKLNPLATYYIRIKELEIGQNNESSENLSTTHYSNIVKVDMEQALLTNVYVDSLMFKANQDEHILRFSYNHNNFAPKNVDEEIKYHSSNVYARRFWDFKYNNDSSLLVGVNVNSTNKNGTWGEKTIHYDYSHSQSNYVTAEVHKNESNKDYNLEIHYNNILFSHIDITKIAYIYNNGKSQDYLFNKKDNFIDEIEKNSNDLTRVDNTTFTFDYDIYEGKYSINYSYILPFQILISFEDIFLPGSIFPDLEFISQAFKFNPNIINSSNGVELYHYEYNDYGLPVERIANHSTTEIFYTINPNKYNPLSNNGN